MKNIFIILSSLLLFFALSCQKETTETKSTEKHIVSNQIADMDKYLIDFRARMNNPLKSGATLNLEEARWHLSALLNFAYADAETHYDFFQVDTFYTILPLQNQLVNMSDLNNAFSALAAGLVDAYFDINSADKTLIVVLVAIKSQSQSEAEIMAVSTIGYNGSIAMSFGPTDWWYWGFKKGKCGEFVGQGIGNDAATRLTHLANLSIPLFQSRVYFTGEITIIIYPTSYPDPGSPSEYRLYIHPTPLPYHHCLSPYEMNYYLQSIKSFGIEQKPAGKMLVTYLCDDDLLLFNYKAFTCHTLSLTYGVPNFTLIPSEL